MSDCSRYSKHPLNAVQVQQAPHQCSAGTACPPSMQCRYSRHPLNAVQIKQAPPQCSVACAIALCHLRLRQHCSSQCACSCDVVWLVVVRQALLKPPLYRTINIFSKQCMNIYFSFNGWHWIKMHFWKILSVKYSVEKK